MGHSRVVRSVAAHGLTSEQEWPATPLDDDAWGAFFFEVKAQRLHGLLLQASTDGVMPLTREQRKAAQAAHFEAVSGVLRLKAATLRTLDILQAADVPVRVLKGPAVAHLDYPDPALRLFGDIDLLIPASHFDQGVEALQQAGHERRFPQPRSGFDRRFSKGTSFRTRDGLEIDYHRTFVMGPFGLRLKVEDLWEDKRTFMIGGREVAALDDTSRFLHACFHTALGNVVPRLVPQRDVVQMLLSPRLDVDRVQYLMARWQAQPVVARALQVAQHDLRLQVEHPLLEWAARRALTPRERGDLTVYSDPEGGYAGKSLRALRALPTFRDRVAFAYALAFPDRAYLEGRYAHSSDRWLRGLHAARRLWSTS